MYQLLLPFSNPLISGIKNDLYLPCYTKFAMYTNTYVIEQKRYGRDYGHKYHICTRDELINLDGRTNALQTVGFLKTRMMAIRPDLN